MKSSVRILAIALALAFLLLARTAFQDTTSAKEHIDLKDGEASFADPINGLNEANYLGFGGKATTTVYFYIESEDLGTQVTASTTNVVADVGGSGREVLTLQVGTAVAGTVDAVDIMLAFDTAYCDATNNATTTVNLTDDDPDGGDIEVTVPSNWGLASSTSQNGVDTCSGTRAAGDASTTTDAVRTAGASAEKKGIEDVDAKRAQDANHGLYTYGSDDDAYTKLNPGLLYSHGANGASVGGGNRPLDSVTAKRVTSDGGSPPVLTSTNLLTFITNAGDGQFQSVSDDDPTSGAERIDVSFTYDIVDMYPAKDMTAANAPHKAYSSGFGRAYVSSGSDSGQWVTIREVASVSMMHNAGSSPTTNLFQGMVVITNDTDHEDDETIYAQDGDTLTLQVFDENGNRSSDVLASATALIDDSPPTISDLSPADDSIINDDTLRISFDVNDDGAGADFRNIEDVVTAVQVEERADSGDEPRNTGNVCTLASGEDQIDNAGGNASRVGVLVAPSGQKFNSDCGTIVDLGNGGKFNLIITAQDLAGNVTTHTTQLTIDKAKPTVVGNPGVGQAWNEDKNKAKSSSNSILVEFNESLDVDTVAAADFTVAGYTIDSVEVVGTNEKGGDQNLNEYVVITLTEDLANNARPSVTVTGVSDVAGNAIETATRTSDNKIKAAITVVPFSALIAEDGQQAITFTSDEALRSKSGNNTTEGSVGDDKVKVTVADNTMGGNAAFKESKYGGSRAYGVMLQAVDVDGNVSKAGEVKVSDEPYELTEDVDDGDKFDVTLDNWPLADTGFDNDVAGEVKAYIGKTMVASSTNEVGWTDGSVELQANAGRSFDEGDTINLSYSYVNADQVIQVDVDEPTMTSIPADNAETDYAAGAIQFKWAEDKEYEGDTYKTVTLNEASHEGPDGESMDILSELTTNDNKTWVYRPAADLALGDHEFTLKATDAAGNSNEVSVTITVIERKPVKINLSPGWNLISLPGMPASADVNDVFSSDTVSVISQYDGRRVSPWTVWTRGSDGSLSSSPAGRTTIDSGLGLWVLSSDGSALEVDIPGTSKDAPAEVPPSIDLITGWNLVAVILISVDEVGVNEYLPEGVWTRAFRLSNTTGQFESFSPATRDTDGTLDEGVALKAGDALWVYAAKAGVIVPK